MTVRQFATRPALLIIYALLGLGSGCAQQENREPARPQDAKSQRTFVNPLLPSGPDPWSFYHDGFYYYMHTYADRLVLMKTRQITDLENAQRKTIWRPPETGPYSRDIWAPEIHRLDDKWYIYFTASSGERGSHRVWALENPSADPMQGEWELKGKVNSASDQWAIDGSVFEHDGERYFIWSGWEEMEPDQEVQNIYIARLENPWTLATQRVLLSSPKFDWERVWDRTTGWKPPIPIYVNEGPQILMGEDQVFLVYSASGCWTNDYCLGMLTASVDSDLLDPASWEKSPEPVFEHAPEHEVYGTGHNSFFKSPDGTQDWILYHAKDAPDQGCGASRSPRAQPIDWRPDGTPDFGRPVPAGEPLAVPSRSAAREPVTAG